MAVMHEWFADMGAYGHRLDGAHRIVEEHGLSLAQETHRRWTATYGEKVRVRQAEVRPSRAGHSRLSRDRRAALVIVLIRKWLQPSGFTQNVQRTQRIVSGQDVILQSLGVITSHSPHDNALDPGRL